MIKSVRLTNFFSFRDCEISLEPDVTVLVGINGSGKTNLLRAFELLKAGMDGRLREKITEWGGSGNILNKSKEPDPTFKGAFHLEYEVTEVYLNSRSKKFLDIQNVWYSLFFNIRGNNNYFVADDIISNDRERYFLISNENSFWHSEQGETAPNISNGVEKAREADTEVSARELYGVSKLAQSVIAAGSEATLYSDFDTRPRSQMRQSIQATGLDVLDADGANLFQILNTIQLKSTEAGDAIEKDLREVNPNFERLQFQPLGQGGMLTYLREIGLKTPIPAAHVSDGTLRYLCLLAIAHNPDRGRLICLDEPERGLHPDMLAGVARLLLDDGHASAEAPRHTSYVVATHSPQLLSHFPLRCLRVFEKDENNQTVVRQFTEEQFKEWYDTFDPGSMWMKGELGGTR